MKFLTAILERFKRPATDVVPEAPRALGPLSQLLASTLHKCGFEAVERNGELVLPSGIGLSVELLDCADAGVEQMRTATRILATHATQFPNGLPEYQHASGDSFEEALANGFADWIGMDLVTLLDGLHDTPHECTYMDVDFPATTQAPARKRRVILGPARHGALPFPDLPSSESQQGAPSETALNSAEECSHSFCPCCLFTNSFDAFRPVLESRDTVGIRLFALRDEQGEISADCRINGVDYPVGVEQLMAYARSWPVRPGLEFRKQYVIIRTAETTPS